MNYLKKYKKDFSNLCTPSVIYLVISIILFSIAAYYNYDNKHVLCLGPYNCYVPNTNLIFLFDILYILFWTFILNTLCKAGYKEISWLILAIPFILSFIILISIFLLYGLK